MTTLGNVFGMGADRVQQLKVVTPDGRTRIANKCQNQDLFFAMRGGGLGACLSRRQSVVELTLA